MYINNTSKQKALHSQVFIVLDCVTFGWQQGKFLTAGNVTSQNEVYVTGLKKFHSIVSGVILLRNYNQA
jgi:hypothetical protein